MGMKIKKWYKEYITLKENKAIVKLYDAENRFVKSVIVPTIQYPLNGKYKIFHCENTEAVKDEKVLEIFDSVKYKIGHCYTNVGILVGRLQNAGYDAKSYAGWLFTGKGEFPVHHCWVVLDGKSVLDLSDDFTAMLSGKNADNFRKTMSKKEMAETIASFQMAARTQKNHIRCYPVGIPTGFLLYIGCECDPEEGRKIYQDLIKNFPNHDCERNCDNSGLNETQRIMREAGLMN